MTESEAKEKWCPFVRFTFNSREGYMMSNREYKQRTGGISHCMASACMAWRWGAKISETEREGHCGLAGND